MKKKYLFIILFQIYTVALLSFALYSVVNSYSPNISDTKSLEGEVLSESSFNLQREQYPHLAICYEDNCYHIGSHKIRRFYNNQELDILGVQMYLLENVVTYFEQLSGDKHLVRNNNGSFYTWVEDEIIDVKNIYTDIINILQNREEKELYLVHNLYKKDLPGTDGRYAEKYIEIDNSKQRLYAWSDGSVVREIDLSGPQEGYQVYGVFPIIDKGVAPIAPGGRYMPYWMAFYYSHRQRSWYGLHSLIWWYDDSGRRVDESVDHIGVRRSKGCVRMLLEDAKFLYENYEIGDHILIHE